jgi:hypothetical protein
MCFARIQLPKPLRTLVFLLSGPAVSWERRVQAELGPPSLDRWMVSPLFWACVLIGGLVFAFLMHILLERNRSE